MNFGDRIIYTDMDSSYYGVYIKELNQVECIVKLDHLKEKSIVNKSSIKFKQNMDNMDLNHALAVADFIAKEKYDGHFTLMCFTTSCKFCFGTLETINYHTTSLLASGKTVEEAIKTAIDNKISADSIMDIVEKMYK